MHPETWLPGAPLRFGANYTPSREWAHAWMDIKPDEVRRDFEGLSSLGLDHVRLLPLWPELQPNRTLIRPRAVEAVRKVVDIAGEFDLAASVDVIQGHLSSFDYLPAWIQTWHRADMFTDPRAIEGETALVTALGEALRSAENFLGLTLGNELNQFSGPPHPEPMPASTVEVTSWLHSLLAAAKQAAPVKTHLHAEYDAVFYQDGHPFVPAQSSRIGDMTSIHSWIFNGTAQRYGGMSGQSLHHAEYLVELSRAFALDPSRPIWLQEVGAPSNCLQVAEIPDFLERTIRRVATSQNLWGITWWCSHDVSRQLADFPELEYTLGLIDSEGKVKPVGRRYAEVIAELRASPTVPALRDIAVEVPVDDESTPISRASLAPGGVLFDAWMDLAISGQAPAFVLSNDGGRAKGFREVVRPGGVERADEYRPSNTRIS